MYSGGGTSENFEIPLVSVVVPIYNTASYLRRCIQSSINQSYKKIEVILINDGSTDESVSICQQYKKADSRFRIVDKINGGISSTRNAGIDVAIGKYICFIDSDDFWESNFIEELVDGFRLHPNVDVTIYNYFYNESEVRACVRTHENSGEIRNRTLTMIEIASPKSFKGFVWNKLYKMDVITRNSLRFDESTALVEDALFNQQYMSYADYSFYIDIPLYHYV